MYGYTGRIAHIDLTEQTIEIEEGNEQLYNEYLGGRGLAIRYIMDNVPKGIDAFDPRNVLVISTGPLCGTLAPSSNRYSIVTKSPLTGRIGYSNSGGHFGPELKYAGYDAVIVSGKADRPVFLQILNNDIQILDASDLWGKDVFETTETLLERVGDPYAQVSCIGPGGENRVLYAAIVNNLARTAARTGVGAVMGSKNLKAIVVRGTRAVQVAEPISFNALIDETLTKIQDDPAFPALSEYGTSFLVDLAHFSGGLATRNNQTGVFELYEGISAETFFEKYRLKSESCFACPIHCGKYSRVREGKFKGSQGGSPEYESIVCLGSKCGIGDLGAIIRANELCNRYGLDTISLGDTVAFAMEAFEKGLLTLEDTDGLDLSWGNADALIELIEKISKREPGIGNLLAEGVKRASEQLPGSEDFALHIKGMEPPAYDVRTAKAFGLGWATSNRGADHLTALPNFELLGYKPEVGKEWFGSEKAVDPYAWESKPEMVVWHENFGAVVDSAEMCKYTCFSAYAVRPEDMARFLTYAVGKEFTTEEVMQIGERIYNLERLFNLREGLTPDEDQLPKRFVKEPLPEGPATGQTVEMDKMLPIYYQLREWDWNTGIPELAKLESLGLKEDAIAAGLQIPEVKQ